MQKVKWIGFGISGALARTYLHFFPASDSVSAPYPANCALTVFAQGLSPKTVELEGSRFGHPDGLRLDDAFPTLKDQVIGPYGIELELSGSQPRLDLRGSSCIIEIFSQGIHSRFYPIRIEEAPEPAVSARNKYFSKQAVETEEPVVAMPRIGLALHDGSQVSSVVFLNRGSSKMIVQAKDTAAFGPVTLEPFTAQEVNIGDAVFENTRESSDGKMRLRPLEFTSRMITTESTNAGSEQANSATDSIDQELAAYMLYRDSVSRRIVSVVAT